MVCFYQRNLQQGEKQMSMTISVCLDALCPQLAAPQAVRLLAGQGVRAVEFWSWQNKDCAALAAACAETGVRVAGMCTASFALTDPARRSEFLAGLAASLPVAAQLGCRLLITQAGPDTGAARAAQHASIVQGLRAAAPLLAQAGVTLAVEPLNTRRDHPDAYLSSSQEAFELVREADSPFVRVLFDIYHQQVTEGDILAHLLPHLPEVAHLHAAATPGRGPLFTGELHYPRLLQRVAQAGYTGCVGLEYTCTGGLLEDLQRDLCELRAAGLH